MNIIENINQDLDFSNKIILSEKYTENVNFSEKSDNSYFSNLAYCIIENNELEAQTYDGDITMFLQQKIISICNDITPELLTTMGFSKSIKPLKFQQSLQLSDVKNIYSTLLFLREYYKTNFVIVDNNIAYIDIIKNYNVQYILFKNDKFRIIEHSPNINKLDSICDILDKDIKGNVYNTSLKNITTYKLPELVDLAKQYNLSTNGKKKELYDRIYKYLVNY